MNFGFIFRSRKNQSSDMLKDAHWFLICCRYCCRLQSKRSGVDNSIEIPLVFVGKGIRNLKCYVAPVQSLVRKRVCRGRHRMNQDV